MIVVATDAPLDSRNLQRLAKRCIAGMARTGASFSNGSGDYAIAFSTAQEVRIRPDAPLRSGGATLDNRQMDPLFQAASEATEEAIINSLFKASTMTGNGVTIPALPVDQVRSLL